VIDIGGAVWLWPILAAPFIGRFMGALVVRVPIGAAVVLGRSACLHYGTRLSALELIPLISFSH
jgi:leader peptidase (prepilin peptidase) / N-methyltransferase